MRHMVEFLVLERSVAECIVNFICCWNIKWSGKNPAIFCICVGDKMHGISHVMLRKWFLLPVILACTDGAESLKRSL